MDRYEIRVAGHLDHRRATSLGCEELRLLPGGDSLLYLRAVDQAALYGLLTRLRDAGLELVAAERVLAGDGATATYGSTEPIEGGSPCRTSTTG
jgi:hypothetical protein